MKKSFLIYIDALEVLDLLTNEQAGILFKIIKDYHNGIETEIQDQFLKGIFFNFKLQFKRDNEKYENICERNKINGLHGGRPKTQDNPKNPLGLKKPKKAHSDNDNDNEIENDIDIKKEKEKKINLQNPEYFEKSQAESTPVITKNGTYTNTHINIGMNEVEWCNLSDIEQLKYKNEMWDEMKNQEQYINEVTALAKINKIYNFEYIKKLKEFMLENADKLHQGLTKNKSHFKNWIKYNNKQPNQ